VSEAPPPPPQPIGTSTSAAAAAAAAADARSEAGSAVASAWRAAAIALAAALLLIVALVATAPSWAPLAPWGMTADRRAQQQALTALAARLDRLAAAQGAVQQQAQQGDRETSAAVQRLQQSASDTAASVQRIGQQIGALAARPAVPAGDIADLRQELAKLSAGMTELASRSDAADKAARAQAAHDAGDAALALAVLQIRRAVAAGGPFAAEYDALMAAARDRPEIAHLAAPLAEPAKTGVATRAALAQGLRELVAPAPAITPSPSPEAARAGWTDALLARLRGLVTIRRVDDGGGTVATAAPAGQPPPTATVNAAERALAGGDLAGAVAALDKLTGASAAAAGDWLRSAHERLAVEAALDRIEAALLTAQPGNSPATAAPRSPG
jgi:hypothetical protein